MKAKFDDLEYEIQEKVVEIYDFRKEYFENDWLLWFGDYLLSVIKNNEERYLNEYNFDITSIELLADNDFVRTPAQRNRLGEIIIRAKINRIDYAIDFDYSDADTCFIESPEKTIVIDSSKENFGLDESYYTSAIAYDIEQLKNSIYQYFDMYYHYNYEDDLWDNMKAFDTYYDTKTGEIIE